MTIGGAQEEQVPAMRQMPRKRWSYHTRAVGSAFPPVAGLLIGCPMNQRLPTSSFVPP